MQYIKSDEIHIKNLFLRCITGIDTEHFCMKMPGIEKQRSSFSTSTMLGSFFREFSDS